MVLIKGLIREENGQGLTEYALVLGLVVLGFWVARRDAGIRAALEDLIRSITDLVNNCC